MTTAVSGVKGFDGFYKYADMMSNLVMLHQRIVQTMLFPYF